MFKPRDTIQSKPVYHQGVQTAWEEGLRSTHDAGPGERTLAWKESSVGIAQQGSQHGGWKLVWELLHLMRITLGTWQIFLKENKIQKFKKWNTFGIKKIKHKWKGESHKIVIYNKHVDCVGDYAMTNCFHQNTVLMKTAHESKCLNFGEVMTIALKNITDSKMQCMHTIQIYLNAKWMHWGNVKMFVN